MDKMITKHTVVRLTTTEFELDNGSVFPHPLPFAEDELPEIEEFQRIYDQWYYTFKEKELIDGATEVS